MEQARIPPSWRAEDEFQEKLTLVAALWGGEAWRPVQTRKDHEDLFGAGIVEGEICYVYDKGPSWGDSLRLGW
jgi:hypothetical protein